MNVPAAALAGELGIADHVEFCVNASFDQLRALLGDAVAGLHTMVDEHFGISVVEYMAAGGHSGRGAGSASSVGARQCSAEGWGGMHADARWPCALLLLHRPTQNCVGRRLVEERFTFYIAPPSAPSLPAGVVPIAHDSAGPREDIVLPEPGPRPGDPPQPTGLRCSSLAQYADAIVEVG